MALNIKQYFFDSIEPNGTDPGDERIYPADEFVSGAVEAILTNGIYDLGENCLIEPTEYAYTVAMQPGKAVINGYIMDALPAAGDADIRHLVQLEPPTGTVRCDRVVVRLNVDFTLAGRFIRPVVIKGTEGSLTPPELVRDEEIYDLSLATVIVRQSASIVPAEDITDTRYDGEVCGVVDFRPRPDLSQLIQALYIQWTTEYAAALEAALEGIDDINDVPGTLSLTKGGTGATTAAGAREALGAAVPAVEYTATFLANSWDQMAATIFQQSVEVTGLTEPTQRPIVDVLFSESSSNWQAEKEQWGNILQIMISGNTAIALYEGDTPTVDLNFTIKVVG